MAQLDFYTKVQVWGRMVRVSPQVPYTPKAILVKKNDVSSALLKKGQFTKERISLGSPKGVCEGDWSTYIGLTRIEINMGR